MSNDIGARSHYQVLLESFPLRQQLASIAHNLVTLNHSVLVIGVIVLRNKGRQAGKRVLLVSMWDSDTLQVHCFDSFNILR